MYAKQSYAKDVNLVKHGKPWVVVPDQLDERQ